MLELSPLDVAESSPPTRNPLRLEYLDPAGLDDHPSNWKLHPSEQLDGLDSFIGRVGWAGALLFNERTGRLLDGHGRKERVKGKGPVPVLIGSWPEEQEADVLAFLDPLGAAWQADKAKVEALAASIVLPDDSDPIFAGMLEAIQADALAAAEAAVEAVPLQGDRPDDGMELVIAMDSRWPSADRWDVPALLPELEPTEVPFPATSWGSQAARRPMPGLWHFYTDDDKFEPLWKYPGRVLLSSPSSVVEPNFSTTDQTPFAFALWQIYRKRWLARWWQSQGLRVFVDLNVDQALNAPHDAVGGEIPNLLGVPRGWRAFATRAHANRPDNLLTEWELAKAHADGKTPLFVVVGGGKVVKEMVKEYRWVHIPEQIEQRKGAREAA